MKLICQQQAKIGLPGKRYQAKGTYNSKGQWQIHAAEKNIDDALEIKKQLENK